MLPRTASANAYFLDFLFLPTNDERTRVTDVPLPAPDLDRARRIPRGRRYSDFVVGDVIAHRRRRTITEADGVLFSTATLAYNPLYLDRTRAEALGHERPVVNPFFLLALVIGLTVEDLSEQSDAFLGLESVDFLRPVSTGETVSARSVVREARVSRTRPGQGVVTWSSEGLVADESVLRLVRSNLFPIDGSDGRPL
jgi:itaconyl-CoA hydratase